MTRKSLKVSRPGLPDKSWEWDEEGQAWAMYLTRVGNGMRKDRPGLCT